MNVSLLIDRFWSCDNAVMQTPWWCHYFHMWKCMIPGDFLGGCLRALRCSPGNPISLIGLRLWQDPVTSGCPGTVCECVAYPIFGQNFTMRMCIFPCITTNVLFGLLLDVIINTLLSVLSRNHESHDHMTLQLCRHHNDLNISCSWQSMYLSRTFAYVISWHISYSYIPFLNYDFWYVLL